LAKSLPADDVLLLVHALSFLTAPGPKSPLDYMAPRTGIWAPDGKLVASLVAITGQAAWVTKQGGAGQAVRTASTALPTPLDPALLKRIDDAIQAAKGKPAVDCLAGKTQAQIAARIGLTPKLGGVAPPPPPAPPKRIVAPLPPVRRPPPPYTPPAYTPSLSPALARQRPMSFPKKLVLGGGGLAAAALAFGFFHKPLRAPEKF
jgi:hypothetical protein